MWDTIIEIMKRNIALLIVFCLLFIVVNASSVLSVSGSPEEDKELHLGNFILLGENYDYISITEKYIDEFLHYLLEAQYIEEIVQVNLKYMINSQTNFIVEGYSEAQFEDEVENIVFSIKLRTILEEISPDIDIPDTLFQEILNL